MNIIHLSIDVPNPRYPGMVWTCIQVGRGLEHLFCSDGLGIYQGLSRKSTPAKRPEFGAGTEQDFARALTSDLP